MSNRGCGREEEIERGREGGREKESECERDTLYFNLFFPFSTGFLMER